VDGPDADAGDDGSEVPAEASVRSDWDGFVIHSGCPPPVESTDIDSRDMPRATQQRIARAARHLYDKAGIRCIHGGR